MRAYHFRLATVRRVRTLEERVARDRFVVARRDVRHAEASEREANSALLALHTPSGAMTVADLVWLGDQAERCADSLRVCQAAVAAAQETCAEAHRAWNEAAKRASVLDRLERDGFAQWRLEAQRREVAELDDMSQARHGRVGAGL